MMAIAICVAWFVLAGVAVAELHGWRPPRREPEVERQADEYAARRKNAGHEYAGWWL